LCGKGADGLHRGETVCKERDLRPVLLSGPLTCVCNFSTMKNTSIYSTRSVPHPNLAQVTMATLQLLLLCRQNDVYTFETPIQYHNAF
jgi:hypothetical protein